MATTVTGDLGNKYCQLKPASYGTVDFVGLDGEVKISAVKGKQAYNIEVRVRIDKDVQFYFSASKGDLKITCNGKSIANAYNVPELTVSANESVSGWTDWYSYEWAVTEKKSTLNISAYLDLDDIVGTYGPDNAPYDKEAGGPVYESLSSVGNLVHFNRLYCSGSFNISGIEIGKAPSLTSISNNNKYTGTTSGTNVSANMTSISIKANADFGDPSATLYWKCGSKSGNTTSSTFTISGLTAGTSYEIEVYLKNSMGSSDTKSITIRTLHKTPVVSLSLQSADLETLTFKWESDKSLKKDSTQYRIGSDGTWTDLSQSGTSGTFTTKWFNPNTKHTIYFKGISTSTYDTRDSNTTSASGTTLDRARITSIGECIFGQPIEIKIENESSKPLELTISNEGNNLTPSVTLTGSDGVKAGTYKFTPTQYRQDQMYKCFTTKNTIPINFVLTTKGDNKDWNDTKQEKTLTLTGIAKTAHVGVSNAPKRCQVWIGDSNNKPRRVVMWVGDSNNKPRRTI